MFIGDIHRQGIEREQELRTLDLDDSYLTYLDQLATHRVYALVFDENEINRLKSSLVLPQRNFFHQACVENGEEFHPRIFGNLQEADLKDIQKIIYINKTIQN